MLLKRKEFINLCRNYSPRPNNKEHSSLAHKILAEVTSYHDSQTEKLPVIWLETNCSCDNNISIMNTTYPYLDRFLEETIDLLYSNTFMAAQGQDAVNNLKAAANQKADQFTLVVEGAIPLKEEYNVVFITSQGEVSALEAVKWLGGLAKYVVALGTCASFGGPSAARPNLSQSAAVSEVLDCEVINVSGCPVNADWFVGTIAHLLMYGRPELDDRNRPTLFYGYTIHRHCQRRSYFDNGNFAENLGEIECMFSQGCVGPKTRADCPYRQWINVNWPVEANTPCIGCTNPDFPDGSTPFFTPLPEKKNS